MIIDKDRINYALSKHDGAILSKTDDPVYDMRLKIVLHGKPIADSRPRGKIKDDAIYFYNPHLEALKKLFKPIYNSDNILKGLVIDRLMKVSLITYYMPTKDLAKGLGLANIKSEMFPSIIVKDNDNAEKVHWDLLANYDFKIILDDNLIWENNTKKLISDDERIEILIDFPSNNDKVHPAYNKEIRSGLKYIYTFINPKMLNKHQLVDPQDISLLHIYFLMMIEKYKLNKQKTFRRTLTKTLEYYPKELMICLLMFLKMGDYEVIKNIKKENLIEMYIEKLLKDTVDNYTSYNKYIEQCKLIIEGDLLYGIEKYIS